MIQGPNDGGRQHPLARAGEVILFWIPVMVPLILLGQLGTKGMRPALQEAAELEEDERKLDEKLLITELRRKDLQHELEALGDSIYRHRNARRLRTPLDPTYPSVERDATPAHKR
jgi:hypothetical protein